MTKRIKNIHIAIALTVFFIVCMAAALGVVMAQTINTMNYENFTEFEQALPTRLLDINGEIITEFASDEKREIISINELPQHMIDALLTREDQDFYRHSGFSIKALMRAVIGKLTGRSLGGGSTLTQQIAGTLYSDRTDISIKRKLVELWWAIQMERRYSKNEILELYLNKIFFGGGTYGVNAASKYYFGHSATEITPAEAAILVIQLSNPAYYNPFEHPNRARDRQQEVLRQMVAKKLISQEEANQSFDTYWENFDYTRINSSAFFMREDKAPWFSEYVRRELSTMIYGNLDMYTAGLTVNTTMNLKHQTAAQNIMAARLEYANRSFRNSSGSRKEAAISTYIPLVALLSLTFDIPQLNVSQERVEIVAQSTFEKQVNPILDVVSLMCGLDNLKISVVNRTNAKIRQDSEKTVIEGALIALENETGYITALVGGSKFETGNQLIRATQAEVQPGSTFKPLYYSAALDSRKFTATSIIYDTPVVFYNENGTPYIPQNFKGEWKGSVQLWYALAKSMNIPSLKILDGIGFDAAIERSAALLGIPQSELARRKFEKVYPFALGVSTVKPIEMARAFAVFGNQGKEVTPIAIRSVEDRYGKIFLDPEKELRIEQKKKGAAIQVISPQNAFIMTDILKNSVSMGTLAGATYSGAKFRYTDEDGKKYTMPVAGKTGTTQNWSDAWAVGYTPYYSTAVWFGFDKKQHSLGLDLTGATLAGPAWADFMRIANEDKPFKNFPQPQTGIIRATVCSVSGDILTPACGNNKTTQYFLEGTQPVKLCELHTSRENARNIGIIRLENSQVLSGINTEKISDDKPLTLDLSFLEQNKDKSEIEKKDETGYTIEAEATDATKQQKKELNFLFD